LGVRPDLLVQVQGPTGDADEKASAQRTPVWASVSVLAGAECPLTGWEDELRRLGGGQGLPGGFIDT
jgi:hypothetical protein